LGDAIDKMGHFCIQSKMHLILLKKSGLGRFALARFSPLAISPLCKFCSAMKFFGSTTYKPTLAKPLICN